MFGEDRMAPHSDRDHIGYLKETKEDELVTALKWCDEHLPVSCTQLILWLAPGVSNEGGSSPLFVPVPAVSWAWVPAWGSLEPSRQDGENAQKTGKTGKKWARYGLRSVNQGS